MIIVKDLYKKFGELSVLNGINEHIKPGEQVVIIGPSGGGKSTFLRCLNLLEQPTSGHIFIDGEEITDAKHDINLLRQQMGMVFQHFNLFPHYSVIDNITLAPIKIKKCKRLKPMIWPCSCWKKSALLIKQTSFRDVFPAGKSSVWLLPEHWL